MFAQKKVTLPSGRHKVVILDEADSEIKERIKKTKDEKKAKKTEITAKAHKTTKGNVTKAAAPKGPKLAVVKDDLFILVSSVHFLLWCFGLTLVLLACIPLIVAAGGRMAMIVSKMSTKGQKAYVKAGTVVEQTVGAIQTVASFTGEKQAIEKYNKKLKVAYF